MRSQTRPNEKLPISTHFDQPEIELRLAKNKNPAKIQA